MPNYDYPLASFTSESLPELDGLSSAASAISGFSGVGYIFTPVAPEVDVIIDFISFSFESTLSAPDLAALDAIVSSYVNPTPASNDSLKNAHQSAIIDVSPNNVAFADVWTSDAISGASSGEKWVVFATVLVNNPSSSAISELNWQLETATDSFQDLEPNSIFPTLGHDNKGTNVVGFPVTTFWVVTLGMNSPRLKLQTRTGAATDINNPRYVALKLA